MGFLLLTVDGAHQLADPTHPMAAPTPNRIATRSLATSVREELLRLIVSGALRPGDRLNEVQLAQAFGISRGPVREAAQELVGLGFLTSRPRLGFYVSQLTSDEIEDLFELKRWMDRALIEDFATFSDPSTLSEIRAEIDGIDATDRLRFGQSLFEFRCRMVTRLHNRLLADFLLILYRKLYLITGLVPVDDRSRRNRILSATRGIFDALLAEEPARAIEIAEADTAHWRSDVAPRFAEPQSS